MYKFYYTFSKNVSDDDAKKGEFGYYPIETVRFSLLENVPTVILLKKTQKAERTQKAILTQSLLVPPEKCHLTSPDKPVDLYIPYT
jgi:hypothetical protein